MSALNRVLIVDDSSIICKLLQNYLGKLHFEVVGVATTGKEALELYREKSPDFVTLDLSMPDMTGYEVLEGLLAIDSDARIIIISALTDKASGLRALKKGAKSFIVKPFSSEKIRDTFQKLIEKYQ